MGLSNASALALAIRQHKKTSKDQLIALIEPGELTREQRATVNKRLTQLSK